MEEIKEGFKKKMKIWFWIALFGFLVLIVLFYAKYNSVDLTNSSINSEKARSLNGTLSQVNESLTYATRYLPSTYNSGTPFLVTIKVNLSAADCGATIAETIPAGWSASNITGDGSGLLVNGVIRWAPIDGPACGGVATHTLTYMAIPNSSQTGTKVFSGLYSVDGSSQAVRGQTNIAQDYNTIIGRAFTIQERTEYDIITNAVFLNIKENLGKNQILNISAIFANSSLTDQIVYKNILMNQSYQSPVYGFVNISLGKYSKTNVSNNGTDNITHYYLSNDTEMVCDYVLGDKSCIIQNFTQTGTETKWDYLPVPDQGQKIMDGSISLTFKNGGIPIAKNSTVQLRYVYKHPIANTNNMPSSSVNKYGFNVTSVDGADNTFLDPDWWNGSWIYNKPIIVESRDSNSKGNTSVLVNVTYTAHMKSDFGDLRFTSSDNATELGYWFYNNTYAASDNVKVYVKIPQNISSAANITIYMYYGNAGVSTTSKLENAFTFGDDFNGALNTTSWNTNGGTASASGGLLTVPSSASGSALISKINMSDYIAEIRTSTSISSNDGWYNLYNAQGSAWALTDVSPWITNNNAQINLGAKSNVTTGGGVANTYYTGRFINPASGNAEISVRWENGTLLTNGLITGISPAFRSGFFKFLRYTSGDGYVDWVYERPYVTNEPNIYFGTEESAPTSSSNQTLLTFVIQNPADITATNLQNASVVISYNITSTSGTGINQSTVALYHLTNSSSRQNYSTLINGSIVSPGFTAWGSAFTNLSAFYNFTFEHDYVYPTNSMLNTSIFENSPHSTNIMSTNNAALKAEVLNMTNNTVFNLLYFTANNVSASSLSLRIYYCNSTYTTGNVATSPNCGQVGNVLASQGVFNVENQSNYWMIPLGINTTTATLGGVKITPDAYFVFRGRVANGWNTSYISQIARTSATQTTTNLGTNWSDLSGSFDYHLHQMNVDSLFNYYVCANDTAVPTNYNCSSIGYDTLNKSDLPPSSPSVYSPTSSRYKTLININYTAAVSPNGYAINYYNISLYYENDTFNQTILANNTNNLSYAWNSSAVLNGTFNIHVEAVDINGLTSFGESEVFAIDNRPDTEYPQITNVLFTPANNTAYVPGAVYVINATITTNNGTSWLQFNNTNYSMTNASDKFNMTLNDLPAGNYPFIIGAYGNGSNANINTTVLSYYKVNQTTAIVFTYINNARATYLMTNGTSVWLNTSLMTGNGLFNLYINNTLINQGTINLGNFTLFNQGGNYTITGNYSGNNNYTAASESWILNVTSLLLNISTTTTTAVSPASPILYNVQSNFSCSNDHGLTTEMFINGVNKTTEKGLLITRGVGTYNINCSADTSGQLVGNSSTATYVVNKATPTGSLSFNPSNSVHTGTATTVTGLESNSGDGDLTYTLKRDGAVTSNPDVQTLGVGSYVYTWIASAGQNYSAATLATNTLTVSSGGGGGATGVWILRQLHDDWFGQENLTFLSTLNQFNRTIEIPNSVGFVTQAYLNLSGILLVSPCYQESTNTTNQSGIDGTGIGGNCGLNYSGNYTQDNGAFNWNSPQNVYDGNWSTSGYVDGDFGASASFNITYRKPSNLIYPINITWQISTGGLISNLSIPLSCAIYNSTYLFLRVTSFRGGTLIPKHSGTRWYCRNGTNEYITLLDTTTTSSSKEVDEEAIIWNNVNSTPNVGYPSNINLTINGTQIYYYPGNFTQTNNRTSNFNNILNNLIPSCTYVNSNCSINISFNSATPGILGYSDILFTNGGFNELSQTWSNSTIESKSENFTMDISYDSLAYSISSALVYNGTSYPATTTSTGNNATINATLTIPSLSVNSGNVSFYWAIALTNLGGTNYYNSTLHNQTINQVSLVTACNATTFLFANISNYDEEKTGSVLSGTTVEYLLTLYNGASIFKQINGSLSLNSFAICTTQNVSTLSSTYSLQLRYFKTGYLTKTYNILNGHMTDIPLTIPLYYLNTTSGTEFVINYVDFNYLTHPGATIQIQRQFIANNTYKTVEIPLIDSSGISHGAFNPSNIRYRLVVTENGQVIDTFNDVFPVCQNLVLGQCAINLRGAKTQTGTIGDDFTYTLTKTNTSIILSYTVPSGTPKLVELISNQDSPFLTNITTCDTVAFSSGGVLTCTYNQTVGDSILNTRVNIDGNPTLFGQVPIQEDLSGSFLGNNYFIAFILMLTLVLIFVTSGIAQLIIIVIGLLFMGFVFLIKQGGTTIISVSIAWLIIAVLIVIYKLSQKEERYIN